MDKHKRVFAPNPEIQTLNTVQKCGASSTLVTFISNTGSTAGRCISWPVYSLSVCYASWKQAQHNKYDCHPVSECSCTLVWVCTIQVVVVLMIWTDVTYAGVAPAFSAEQSIKHCSTCTYCLRMHMLVEVNVNRWKQREGSKHQGRQSTSRRREGGI